MKGEIRPVQPVDALPSLLPRDLFDRFAAGIFVTDALGDVLAVNGAAAGMLGYSPEELAGKNLAAFTHPEDVRKSPGILNPGQTLGVRRRLLHKDGRYRLTDGTAQALDDGRIVSVVSDVTTLATAEHALDENAEQLRFVANAVPALIAYVDTDARYVWGNESYRRWYGYPPEQIRGRHVSDVLGASAWASIQPYVERALAGEEVTFDDRLVYKSGPARDIRATYVPHFDGAGRVRGFVGLVNDITEIRSAESSIAPERAHARAFAVDGARGKLGIDPRSGRGDGRRLATLVGRDVSDLRPRARRGHEARVLPVRPPRGSRRVAGDLERRPPARRAVREGIPDRPAGRGRAGDPQAGTDSSAMAAASQCECSAPARTSPSARGSNARCA